MIKRVSCVLKMFDSSTNSAVLLQQVRLCIDGCPVIKPIYKAGGYFVFIDLPEGEHTVTIDSAVFQPEEQVVNVDYSKCFDEKLDVLTVMLNPSAMHRSASQGIVIKGVFSKAPTMFYAANGSNRLKVAEDGADKGKQSIKLFSGGARIALPSLFRINDKTEKNCEFVMLVSAKGDDYTLGSPLKFAHKRSTEFIPMVKYRCSPDGSFFAVLPGGSVIDGEAELLIDNGGKLLSKKVRVENIGINDVGIIKI